MEETYEEEIDLKDYLWVMYKRRWTIISIVVFVTALGIVYTLTRVPIYRATTLILIEKENPNIVDFKELYAVDATSQDFYQTQYKILESRFLAARVIDALNLENNHAFNPRSRGMRSYVTGAVFFWRRGEKKRGHGAKPDDKEGLVEKFLGSVSVEPVRNTRLARIHFESEDPLLAAQAANGIVESYMEDNLETQVEAAYGATDFLSRKIEEQRKRLEESELLLHKYKEEYNIISLKESENIIVAKLAELNSDVLDAENARVEAEMRYNQARAIQDSPEMIESIPRVISNAFITSLKTDEARLTEELSDFSKKYGEKHPTIISIKEKLRTTREKLNTEIKKAVNFLKNEYEIALAKETTLTKALNELKDQSQLLSKRAITYNVLLRDVQINQQMYEILLTRLKETGITGGIQRTNVRVLDEAIVPESPVKPKRLLTILFSLFVGLFGGISFAFFLEYLDNSIKTPEDIKRYLQTPYLGPVPSYKAQPGIDSKQDSMLVTVHQPQSNAAESYKGLRTAIIFSSPTANKKTLLVTSAGPSEGKSLTVSNLAVTMAQADSRILLIDADLRKPRIHEIFGLNKGIGLSNLLVEESRLEEVVRKTDIPNLEIITCGHLPPNPAELLGSQTMRDMIELLKERYDKILFDTCPVLAITDAVILSAMVDEVVLVIKEGKTSRDMTARAMEQLRDVRANLLGAVLNDIRMGQQSYYQYYYYSSYGHDESERKRSSRQGHA
ncbi:MAG: GumC family protein [bacterium]